MLNRLRKIVRLPRKSKDSHDKCNVMVAEGVAWASVIKG
jgi:hypothetical protein